MKYTYISFWGNSKFEI